MFHVFGSLQVGASAWAQSFSSTAGGSLSWSQFFLRLPLWSDSFSCLKVLVSCWRWSQNLNISANNCCVVFIWSMLVQDLVLKFHSAGQNFSLVCSLVCIIVCLQLWDRMPNTMRRGWSWSAFMTPTGEPRVSQRKSSLWVTMMMTSITTHVVECSMNVLSFLTVGLKTWTALVGPLVRCQ